jgi:hypothetical protein
MDFNKAWHNNNPFPKHAKIGQLIVWHIDHKQNCKCYVAIPDELKTEMEKHQIKIPTFSKK